MSLTNHPLYKTKPFMIAVNKNDSSKKIVFMGTMHFAGHKDITNAYLYVIMNLMKNTKGSIELAPETCTILTTVLLSLLFSRRITASYTFKQLRSFLKSDSAKEKFDAFCQSIGVEKKNYGGKIGSKIMSIAFEKSGYDRSHFMDMYILDIARSLFNLKCRSLDDMIFLPFWNKTVRKLKVQRMETKDEFKGSSDSEKLEQFRKMFSLNFMNVLAKDINSNINTSNADTVIFHQRNRIWHKKLVERSKKTDIQIALVGANHIRRGSVSLKSLFKADKDWDVYDFKDYSGSMTYAGMLGMLKFIKKVEKTRQNIQKNNSVLK